MPITSGDVEKALNEFRALMKPCFIDSASFAGIPKLILVVEYKYHLKYKIMLVVQTKLQIIV